MERHHVYKIINANRIFWSICFLLLLAGLIVQVTVIREQRNEINRQNEYYQELRSRWKPSSVTQDGFYVFEKRNLALETFLESLPRMTNLSDKARELRSFLHNHHIGSGKIQFTPDRKEGLALWKYSTTLSAYGTYEDIKGFLAEIQRSPSLFCIEHLKLSRGTKPGQINMGLRIATYCR